MWRFGRQTKTHFQAGEKLTWRQSTEVKCFSSFERLFTAEIICERFSSLHTNVRVVIAHPRSHPINSLLSVKRRRIHVCNARLCLLIDRKAANKSRNVGWTYSLGGSRKLVCSELKFITFRVGNEILHSFDCCFFSDLKWFFEWFRCSTGHPTTRKHTQSHTPDNPSFSQKEMMANRPWSSFFLCCRCRRYCWGGTWKLLWKKWRRTENIFYVCSVYFSPHLSRRISGNGSGGGGVR